MNNVKNAFLNVIPHVWIVIKQIQLIV